MQLAYMRCANKELAEDLVQETCLKAYKSYIERNEEVENPKAWLSKILVNTHIDYTRKKQPNSVNLEEVDIPVTENPTKNIETNIFFKDLEIALKQLEPEQRVVVYLSDVNEYTYKEIANFLEIPLGTVMSRLHRARQTLRKHLTEKEYMKTIGKEK